ncbi:immunity 26/phosphotriesterase HocA family protein [Ferribacterium limneticum]|uniref:immunity 26/phosphotriesterase HocA family protein n=1 Tax=Ferribacterium limneticum TaxID=76259 RepID=UPI001CFC1701|nr:immunity 26/phosphotriesterase HocA family protein [Ferribacterium limneticum]UCV27574.1 immunity 26/phosphotriesterase HocA family protein [Ferribacterium limneticum]UCV31491.1 immunity 26/phosphotriesterase HocA family protein [Ferribacterium limneticum]
MSKPRRSKYRLLEGDIVRIDLGEGWFSFGRKLLASVWAFYDFRSRDEIAPEEIVRQPVLFKVWAGERAGLEKGAWKLLGHIPLTDEERQPVPFFKQDILDPTHIAIYMSDSLGLDSEKEEIPATWEEIQGLEDMGVWYTPYVEDRLRDHFAGRPCKWVQGPKPPKIPTGAAVH